MGEFEDEVALHEAHRVAAACLHGEAHQYSYADLAQALATLEREYVRQVELEES